MSKNTSPQQRFVEGKRASFLNKTQEGKEKREHLLINSDIKKSARVVRQKRNNKYLHVSSCCKTTQICLG